MGNGNRYFSFEEYNVNVYNVMLKQYYLLIDT